MVTAAQPSCKFPLTYILVTPYDFLSHELGDNFVTLEVINELWEEAVYEDAYILFKRDSLSIKLPIKVAFENCLTTAINF